MNGNALSRRSRTNLITSKKLQKFNQFKNISAYSWRSIFFDLKEKLTEMNKKKTIQFERQTKVAMRAVERITDAAHTSIARLILISCRNIGL